MRLVELFQKEIDRLRLIIKIQKQIIEKQRRRIEIYEAMLEEDSVDEYKGEPTHD